ncbi:MAG: [FeFe] hydrogenase H-cluster radical SAM maturase HydG [Thermoanaerobacteraceae bacterium]|nr:[FeFe] hydrogenase H-cluster radical SAM maturase HydG [Thermoanaerobacteraceae bacterium]
MYNEMKADFIDDERINEDLNKGERFTKADILKVIDRAKEARGLEPVEVAALLHVEDDDLLNCIYEAAREIKEKIYGKRIVLFAPLYLSNYCVNNCQYCGYGHRNSITRKKLTMEELEDEVRVLESLGHKRLALEAGEDPVNCPIEYILDCISTIYRVQNENGNIRRVNVNIAATTVENYKKLKAAKIGTYILFQETYHRPTYAYMHPTGPKHDYDYHTTAHIRAMEGGIDDVGLGVLFGLYDYKYEVMGLIYNAMYLDRILSVGPHTISVPRIRPAAGVNIDEYPYLVPDKEFKKLVAIIRLAVPYTGMILTTREHPGFREDVMSVGISQISAGSCTGVGGYKKEYEYKESDQDTAQFEVEDNRTPDEVLRNLCRQGYLPSYCTACYRKFRTGDRFMKLAKTGNIQNCCQPNAILTFKEYLMDYASEETRAIGEETIREHLNQIKSPKVRKMTEERLRLIENGQRDLYF